MTTTYWFAVQTRSRAEYAALADINGMDGLEAYLPQETRQRRTHRGKEAVLHPLLPGFIFVGSSVPQIAAVASTDHPHPIFDVLKSKAVRGLVRSPGGGVHPIRPQVIDGWRVNFVDHLREREAAGAFDYTPRQKPEAKAALFQKGDLKELMAMASRALFPDLKAHAA